jgi:hypothetical protein
MHKRPSPWSVLWTDYVCCSIATAAPMVFLLALAIKLTGTIPGSRGRPDTPVEPEVASMVLACAVALSLFVAAIVALRVARIRSLFDEGREVEATVRKVAYVRSARGASRQKLELEFELHGIPHVVSFTFLRTSKTPAFSEGARISVLVDPANPKRVVPLTLYGDPAFAASV